MLSSKEIILRLMLGTLLGGLIGVEREVNNRPAGLRTHVLVTLGSTIFMLISIDGYNYIGLDERIGDPFRIAAQVVSGIGFLGAGTIMKTGNDIQGLTTAASLWVSAGIGLAMGAGYYIAGIITTIIVVITLLNLGLDNTKLFKDKYRVIQVVSEDKLEIVTEIGSFLSGFRVKIKELNVQYDNEDKKQKKLILNILVQLPIQFDGILFHKEISEIPGIEEVEFKGVSLEEYKYSKKNNIKDRE